jgi:polysaccharide pyruvyl transferase WcaK-like protein
MTDRRTFIKQMGLLSAAMFLPYCLNALMNGKTNPHLLVVSGWQDVNIGDIAHTPGLLHVLQSHLPQATITLWKRSKSETVEALLKKKFTNVEIIYGNPDKDFTITDPQLLDAIDRADVFIHGSGPSVVAANCLEAWRKITDKPFGVYGTTIQDISPSLKNLLNDASFIFTRETASIDKLKEAGVSGPQIRFIPDATFALDIHDEESAASFMKANDLEDRKFICVIPRLRKTPYWLIHPANYTEKQITEITALNDKWKQIDHAKAREAIVRWVRETGNRVLICPEMTYQIDIMDELLIDPLPDDVKKNVVKRGYWLPDEAASLYAKAFCVLSFECHSPIISLRNGTPAMYLRQPEDTIKGQMYYDLGFDKWVFEINDTTGQQIADRLMEVYYDHSGAQAYLKRGMDKASRLFEAGIKIISQLHAG